MASDEDSSFSSQAQEQLVSNIIRLNKDSNAPSVRIYFALGSW